MIDPEETEALIEDLKSVNSSMLLPETKSLLTCALLFGYDSMGSHNAAQCGMHANDFEAAFQEIRPAMAERNPHHHLIASLVESVNNKNRTIIMRSEDTDEG